MAYIINPNIDKEKRVNQIFEFIKDKQFYCAVAYAKVCKRREDEWNKVKYIKKTRNTEYDFFDRLYTLLAYAFDDPCYGKKAYDNFYFDIELEKDKDIKIKMIEDKSYEDSLSSFLGDDFINFLFLSIAIRVLYSYKNKNSNVIDKNEINDILNNNDIFKKKAKNSDTSKKITDIQKNIIENLKIIVEKFYDFNNNSSFSSKELSYYLENKEQKKKIIDRQNSDTPIKEFNFNLEQEIKQYLFKTKDDESKIRNEIFSVDLNLYNDLKNAIDTNDSSSLLFLDNVEFYDLRNDGSLKINRKNIRSYIDTKCRKINTEFKEKEPDKFDNICDNLEDLLKNVYDYLKNINDNKSDKQAYVDIDETIKVCNEVFPKFQNLIDNIEILLAKKINLEDEDSGYIEGLSTLLYTIYNLRDFIDIKKERKDYKYQYNKYFYIPFLLSDDVLLKEDFVPDFPDFYFEKTFLPFSFDSADEKKKELLNLIVLENIIIEHVNKFKGILYSFYDLESKLRENKISKIYDNNTITDNYTINILIDKYLLADANTPSKNDNYDIDEINDAKEESEFVQQDFNGKLELAECYCRLQEVDLLNEKDFDKARKDSFDLYINFKDNIEKFQKWLCVENKNFDYFKKVISKYSTYIDCNSKALKEYWKDRIEEAKKKSEYKEYIDKFNKLSDFLKDENYSVVSEFLDNICEFLKNNKKDELNKFLLNFNNEIKDDLYDFLANYIDIEDFCYASADTKLYRTVIDKGLDDKNKSLLLDVAKNWENLFSVLKKSYQIDKDKLKELLCFLGFNINDKDKDIKDGKIFELKDVKNQIQKLQSCDITVFDNDNISDNHQFASFIPYIFKNGFRVIFFNDDFLFNFDADNIEKLINFSDEDEIVKKHTVILFNRKISLKDRRKLSDAIKTIRQNKNSLFLFIDRIVIFFLLRKFSECLSIANKKGKDVKEIVNDCLMSLILPFGFYQPYYSSTSSNKKDFLIGDNDREIMFVGRREELDKIKNPIGPFMIVYGGRQLGKSLLLRQAEKDINKKEDSIAIVIDLLTDTELDKILKKIVDALKDKGIFENSDIKDWDQFQNEIEEFLKKSDKKLYLLLDEVDGFITSCKNIPKLPDKDKPFKIPDKPFKIIEDISNKYGNKFNVVLAGLNLYIDFRGDNGFFKKGNYIGGHLREENCIHIKPFEIREARELIEKPLHYLGLDFSKSFSLIYLILDDTNYYPCLIQMYCKRMLENVNVYSSNGPIYEVEKKFIYKFLIDQKFKGDVKYTFDLTLELNSNGDNDKEEYTFRYLANMLALLCYEQGYRAYTLKEFQELAIREKIDKISNLSDGDLQDILKLLIKLSVFEKDDEGYRFKRFSLFKLMGTKETIRAKLKEYISKDKK